MDLIPLIQMKNRRIFLTEKSNDISYKEVLSQIEGEKKLYILDFDGIKKDRPSLCTYQRLSGIIDFWADSGQRDQGDVVDATMSGATDITLRKELCPKIKISGLKEITENKIYENIDNYEEIYSNASDGFVNFKGRGQIEKDLKFRDFLKRKSANNAVFVYENDLKNLNYWKYFNIKGLLVDLDKVKEFKNALGS